MLNHQLWREAFWIEQCRRSARQLRKKLRRGGGDRGETQDAVLQLKVIFENNVQIGQSRLEQAIRALEEKMSVLRYQEQHRSDVAGLLLREKVLRRHRLRRAQQTIVLTAGKYTLLLANSQLKMRLLEIRFRSIARLSQEVTALLKNAATSSNTVLPKSAVLLRSTSLSPDRTRLTADLPRARETAEQVRARQTPLTAEQARARQTPLTAERLTQ